MHRHEATSVPRILNDAATLVVLGCDASLIMLTVAQNSNPRSFRACCQRLTLPACFSPVRAVMVMLGCRALNRTTSAPV